jgi:DNA-binding ferritin-like protein
MVTSLEIYRELEQKRYDYLTPAEQKIVRLGAAAVACQSAMDEHKRLKQTEDYSKMEVMLESFLSQLEIAIAFRSSTIP